MHNLEREGIFMAKVVSWGIRGSERSMARSITMRFHILAELEGKEWKSWGNDGYNYEDCTCWGDFWVVKRDGTIDVKQLDDLSVALDWNGDVREMEKGLPKNTVVQITVREEQQEKNGAMVIRFKARWIRPKDFRPNSKRDPVKEKAKVADLHAQYGSQFRAALGSTAHDRGKKEALLPSKGPPPAKKAPETLCPVSPAEGAEPFDLPAEMGDPNQDEGNPYQDVPDEAGDAPPFG